MVLELLPIGIPVEIREKYTSSPHRILVCLKIVLVKHLISNHLALRILLTITVFLSGLIVGYVLIRLFWVPSMTPRILRVLSYLAPSIVLVDELVEGFVVVTITLLLHIIGVDISIATLRLVLVVVCVEVAFRRGIEQVGDLDLSVVLFRRLLIALVMLARRLLVLCRLLLEWLPFLGWLILVLMCLTTHS